MEKMSLREFKQYCAIKQFGLISLHHDNQKWESVSNPLKYQLSFNSIKVSVAPDIGCIMLGDLNNCVYMQPIRYVLVDESRIPPQTVAHIVCGPRHDQSKRIQYRIIMH